MLLNIINDQYHSLTPFLVPMILKYASIPDLWIQMKVSYMRQNKESEQAIYFIYVCLNIFI